MRYVRARESGRHVRVPSTPFSVSFHISADRFLRDRLSSSPGSLFRTLSRDGNDAATVGRDTMARKRSALYVALVAVAASLFAIDGSNAFSLKNQTNAAPLLKEKPFWLKTCRKNDTKLNECLNDLFTEMFPQLAKGIPIINIERFEPLLLDRVSVNKGSGAVTLGGSLYDLIVHGPSKAYPTFSDMDVAKKKYNFGIDLPVLDIDSKYDLKGKILVLPLVGNGDCKLVLKDVRTIIATDIDFVRVEGREIMRVTDMKVMFKVGAMNIRLDNLFNGNKVLGLTVNNFLNQNGVEVIAELSDSIGESLSAIFKGLINNIFSKMPTDLWLLDN